MKVLTKQEQIVLLRSKGFSVLEIASILAYSEAEVKEVLSI